MLGINKVILIGNLGKDPDLRHTANGSSVASFPLATSERWNDKSGAKQEHTEWHNIVAWGKLADIAHQYLKKGKSVYIEGKITNRSWNDKEGNKRYRTEIVANQLQFLGLSGSPELGAAADDHSESSPAEYPMNSPAFAQNQPAAAEDDLPF